MSEKHTTFLPLVMSAPVTLKQAFADCGIAFGMAAEASSFDSIVQRPLLEAQAETVTSEVAVKMEHTHPNPGEFDFSLIDALANVCQKYGIRLHGHCVVWHVQRPAWLDQVLTQLSESGGYDLLAFHVQTVVAHLVGKCQSVDLVNELQPGVEFRAGGWTKLGMGVGRFSFEKAREVCGDMKLFYNSFFPSDDDVDYAIGLLDIADGIGVQLHINSVGDWQKQLDRTARLAEAAGLYGKTLRLSEVSVGGKDMDAVAEIYRRTVQLAKTFPGIITDYVTWGVKGQAWNGGWLLFDNAGEPNQAYEAVLDELAPPKGKEAKEKKAKQPKVILPIEDNWRTK